MLRTCQRPRRPIHLQLWYNGQRPIRIGQGCQWSGLIYAPNAVVEIAPHVDYAGAIVAKEIRAEGGFFGVYDLALHGPLDFNQ